jgi:hypothetical protein
MASFRYRINQWQARVRRKGFPDETKSFTTRQEAEKWACSIESNMDKGLFVDASEAQRNTLRDLIERYLIEVTPHMKGASDDTIRLKAIMRKPIAQWSMVGNFAVGTTIFKLMAYRCWKVWPFKVLVLRLRHIKRQLRALTH